MFHLKLDILDFLKISVLERDVLAALCSVCPYLVYFSEFAVFSIALSPLK